MLYHNVTIRYPVVGGGAYRMVEEACLVIGVVGVWILSTAWVLIVIWDYAGIETFALPTVAQAKTLAVLVSVRGESVRMAWMKGSRPWETNRMRINSESTVAGGLWFRVAVDDA